jgi:deazaflavin-dependent oxidoreductase (nitroreductase family)
MSTRPTRTPDPKNDLKSHLARSRGITITVTGRNSGRAFCIPVWFVFENGKLYLVPVTGSDTQWYKNVLKNPSILVEAGGAEGKVKVTPIIDYKQVSSIIEKFRTKYGPREIKKYYSKLDVAVTADLQ